MHLVHRSVPFWGYGPINCLPRQCQLEDSLNDTKYKKHYPCLRAHSCPQREQAICSLIPPKYKQICQWSIELRMHLIPAGQETAWVSETGKRDVPERWTYTSIVNAGVVSIRKMQPKRAATSAAYPDRAQTLEPPPLPWVWDQVNLEDSGPRFFAILTVVDGLEVGLLGTVRW